MSDRDEFIELMRASRALHEPWSFPPTSRPEFDALLERARREDFEMLLLVRHGGDGAGASDGTVLGFFNLSQIFRGPLQSAYLGYAVGAPHARHGYMREGLMLVLRHAFGKLKLHRLEANIQPANAASIALARGAGFRREGFSPQYLRIDGQWRDHERWAILADEALGRK